MPAFTNIIILMFHLLHPIYHVLGTTSLCRMCHRLMGTIRRSYQPKAYQSMNKMRGKKGTKLNPKSEMEIISLVEIFRPPFNHKTAMLLVAYETRERC